MNSVHFSRASDADTQPYPAHEIMARQERKKRGISANVGAEMERRGSGPGRGQTSLCHFTDDNHRLAGGVFFARQTYFFGGCKVTGCARASVASGGLASRSFVAPQATHSIHCLSPSMTRWILSICPHSGQVAPAINWRFIENPLSLELRVTGFENPATRGFSFRNSLLVTRYLTAPAQKTLLRDSVPSVVKISR